LSAGSSGMRALICMMIRPILRRLRQGFKAL
jgi:hypothetical protein